MENRLSHICSPQWAHRSTRDVDALMKDTIRFLKFEHFSGVLELFQALVKGSATRMIHHMI